MVEERYPGMEVMKPKAGNKHERKIYLKCRVRDEGPKLYPAYTRHFEPHMIYDYPGFSKICFNRRSKDGGNPAGMYTHTGVLIWISDKPYVLELKCGSGGSCSTSLECFTAPASLCLTPFFDLYQDDAPVTNEATFIDNSYLLSSRIDSRDILYRAVRLMGAGIQYDARQMNCDVLSTFLVSGNACFVTMNCRCFRIHSRLPSSMPIRLPQRISGVTGITRDHLQEVERSSSLLTQRTVLLSIATERHEG